MNGSIECCLLGLVHDKMANELLYLPVACKEAMTFDEAATGALFGCFLTARKTNIKFSESIEPANEANGET